ncbi:LacI family DNA-binding transcriptional regulator [Devosia sp. FJ2-5-3]|uniref:LacI family DNA-binding transcriptional regulator n=1 Tax=Devosia sp. FJ2-5-3 TaxID=2976680 RepID=UPI0023D82F8B|nr:LacI family DNA-binding transcriptional regulator [Devosia sp. FJ2-5-3]WEJ59787.1 LacI family transcriptional regulator [Devosia sp. FJ2-5-3]
MNKSGYRLSDIAERTGYSKNTVSLALRDSPRISEATRLVIRQAADELQYRPNYFAKSLSSRTSRTIGLLLADISNPILTETSKSLETELATHGYGTLFATANSTLSEEVAAVEMFRSRQVDGILVYPTRDHRNYQHLVEMRKSGFPLVMLIPGENIGVDMISVDEKRGAYIAVRHLIDLGHTRVGTIDGSDPRGNRHKFDGYLQALASAGIPFDPAFQVDPRGFTPKSGYWAMDALMSARRRPTAVFVANDYIAIGVMKWCLKHGLSVPGDVAIIGFDNLEAGEYLSVTLSTVSYKTEDITRMAVERLLRLIDSPGNLPDPRVTLFEPELVIRESTGGAREA